MADQDLSRRVGKPDFYHGDRGKLDDWLNQLDLYFMFENVAQNRRTLFAITYMRGRAQHWIKPRLTAHFQEEEDKEEIIVNFNISRQPSEESLESLMRKKPQYASFNTFNRKLQQQIMQQSFRNTCPLRNGMTMHLW